MKVLVFTNLFPNSIYPNHGIFTLHRMGNFHRLAGCEIKVVAPVPYCPPLPFLGRWYSYSRIKKLEQIDGIDVYHPRYPLIPKASMPFHGLSMFLYSLQLVKKIHRDFPYDLVDGHYLYPDGFAAVLLARMMGKPVVLSALGSDIHEFAKYRLIKPMIQYAATRSNLCITVCNALKNEMVDLGIAEDKIVVIPSGVDTGRFAPGDRATARKKLSLPEHKKIVLSVGSLIPLKGFHTIIDALPNLLLQDIEIELYIVGEGPYRQALMERAAAKGVSRHVIFAGLRPNTELPDWYNAADVFCLASFREGWPNVVMESLACATPVVATRVYGTPEILVSPDLGILTDTTPESMEAGLRGALGTHWERPKIRAYIEAYTWQNIAARIQAAFHTALGVDQNKNHPSSGFARTSHRPQRKYPCP
jgi:teichuronic acid biosynthesis glycosyltransferase TuaC